MTWQRGLAALQAGQVDRAIEILGAVAVAEPSNAEAHQCLGVAHAQKRQWEQSLAALTRAVRLAPGDARARYNLGEVYRQMGRTADARQEYLGALRIDPAYTPARNALGAMRAADVRPRAETAEEPIGIPQLAFRVVTSPVEALEYDVPRYVRSEGAALKIVLFYILCMSPLIIAKAIQAIIQAADTRGAVWAVISAPAAIMAQVITSVLALALLSAAIAAVSILFGRSEGFLTDAAELGLRFALVGGTTQLVGYSVWLMANMAVPLLPAFAGFSLLVLLATFAWTMYLYVLVVMVTYDYGCGPATVLVLTTGLFMLYIRSLMLGAL